MDGISKSLQRSLFKRTVDAIKFTNRVLGI